MLPTTVYEFLPYLYMLLGAAIGLALGGYPAAFGLLLFGCGAVIWVLRSGHRRRNTHLRPNQVARWYWTASIYEAIPFLYITIGLGLLQFMHHPVRFISGSLFIAAGLVVMTLRSRERSKANPIRTSTRRNDNRAVAESSIITKSETNFILDLETQDAPQDAVIQDDRPESSNFSSGECENCATRDICAETHLKEECVRELMRRFQTLSADYSYEMFHDAVENLEGRRLTEAELRPIIRRLEAHSAHCLSWRKVGRHAA